MAKPSKTDEANDYDKAGDDATRRGQHNAAEMFHDMAADERVEAERDRRAATTPRRS